MNIAVVFCLFRRSVDLFTHVKFANVKTKTIIVRMKSNENLVTKPNITCFSLTYLRIQRSKFNIQVLKLHSKDSMQNDYSYKDMV